MLLLWVNGSKWSIYDIYQLSNVNRKCCVHNYLGIITIFDVMRSGRRGRKFKSCRPDCYPVRTYDESRESFLHAQMRT